MEIDPNPTDAPGHSDAGQRGQFTSSHSLPSLATSSHNPARPPHSQAPGAHILEYSQPAHLTPIQSAGSFPASPTTTSLQQLQDQKRPRACESCRGLKVRCELNADDPAKQCRRCAKANRECVFTAPSRKRQKKADTKVAELEKKIDALTASLNVTKQMATGASQGGDYDEGDYEDETPTEVVVEAAISSLVSAHPTKRRRESDDNEARQRIRSDAEKYPVFYPFLAPKGSKIPVSTHIKPADGNAHQCEYVDVIDRELLGIEMARKIFDHYVEDLVPHFPAVVFPPGTTADEVRKEKPTLFLAILASASRMNHPDLHYALHKEISRALADKIMINGEKNLELVQALLVTALWYYPPEHAEELKFNMLTHQAAAMALEIGLGRKTVLSKSRAPGTCSMSSAMRLGEGIGPHGPWVPGPCEAHPPPGDRKHGFPNPSPGPVSRMPYPDSSTLESRRTLLACYWTCCNISMTLRRPNMLRFTPFMAECVQELEANPKAAKTDTRLANLVKVQKIAEDVGNEFAFDQVDAVVNLQEERVQFKLREFNRRLKTWREDLPENAWHPQLEMSFHTVSIYTNEIVLHNNHNVDDFRPPYAESLLRPPPTSAQPLTPLHLNAITTCMSAAHTVLSTFFSLPLISARSVPMFSFIRCSYSCIVLLKIYFTASCPKSELGRHLDRNSLKITHFLDQLISRLEEVAADDKCRGAKKFVVMVMMLKTWYLRQSAEVERALGMPIEPAASLSRLDLGDSERGTGAGGTPGSPSTGGDSAPTPLPNSNYPQSPSTRMPRSPGTMPLHLLSDTALGNSNTNSTWESKYFMQQQQQQNPTQNPFLPPTPPQPQQQPLVRTPGTPSFTSTDELTGPTMPPEQFPFTGNGEVFVNDNFWTFMDGMGMLNWSPGF